MKSDEVPAAATAAAPPPPSALPPPPQRWLAPRPRAEAGSEAQHLQQMLQKLSLQQAPPAPLPKKLLVLDMNGLLFWRGRKGSPELAAISQAPDATAGQFAIYSRPHLHEFMAWCSQRFELAVWSTAQRKNLDPMIRLAFHGLPPPRLVFDQTNCTDTGQLHPGDTTGTHRVLIKELARLWADARLDSGRYGAANTLLIDDSPYKAVANPEHTAIHPIEWRGPSDANAFNTTALGPAGVLRVVLEDVARSHDVRDVVRRLSAERGEAAQHFSDPSGDTMLAQLRAARPEWQSAQPTVAGSTAPSTPGFSATASASLLGMLGIAPSMPPSPPGSRSPSPPPSSPPSSPPSPPPSPRGRGRRHPRHRRLATLLRRWRATTTARPM